MMMMIITIVVIIIIIIIIITVLGDAPIEEKEKEKLENYQDLRGEVALLWLVTVTVMHLVVGALGMIELTKESSANTSICINGISRESRIVWSFGESS